MKILFISAGDYKYGAPKSMFGLMVDLRENYGVTPILLTKRHNPMNEECDRLGIENYSFWSRDIMAGSAYRNPILNILKQCIKYCLYILGGITRYGIKNTDIPLDEINIIHTNLNRNDIGAYLSQKYDIPHIWHLREHGKEDYNVRAYRSNVAAYMNDNADCFIAISEAVKKVWVERGIPAEKVRVVYNGLDSAIFCPKQTRKDDIIRIVMTGHIQPTKGQDQLVKAVGLLSDEIKKRIRIDLYGEAYKDYESYLNKQILQYRLQGIVKFCGYCSNIPAKLSEYDIGIVCSKAEGFGRVTVEYMMAELLVIASDTGANPELIQDDVDGMLYSYGDSRQLAEKIEKIVNDPELIPQYGKAARTNAVNKFSMQRHVSEVYSVYRQIAAGEYQG